jgi:hypothetical protein
MSPPLDLCRSLLANQHWVWSVSASDVFRLVAYDRCDTRLEIFGRFDWPLHGSR